MAERKYTMGTIEASEQLIHELYIELRNKVNFWSNITQQTPQARMGYIGQHLVSIVTGYPGGKSGARGHDLEISPTEYGEIKTCYRVDQLGVCKNCNEKVSSLETVCARCKSKNIDRKDDSKWLITIDNDIEFAKLLEPKYYYFVLFEFEDISDIDNRTIIASIWKVDPKNVGFSFCLIEYYLNIRSASISKAPFNMWPYQLKFYLTRPEQIYLSRILENGSVNTILFPTPSYEYTDNIPPLNVFARSTTLTTDALYKSIIDLFGITPEIGLSKNKLIELFEKNRNIQKTPNSIICDTLAMNIYLPLINNKKDSIPKIIRDYYSPIF